MKKIFTTLILASFFFSACRKEKNYFAENIENCESQTGVPLGKSYYFSSITEFTYSKKKCGIIPLCTKNFWVYKDSIFNDGIFAYIKYDTLRFSSTWKSQIDGLVWWKSNKYIGLPEMLLASDSAIFGLEYRIFSPDYLDVKKDFFLFPGESSQFPSCFNDVAAQGQSIKIQSDFNTPAGSFKDCIFSEKNARGYRKEQLYFKPGIGVLKYILERATMGLYTVKFQQISTLVSFHIE